MIAKINHIFVFTFVSAVFFFSISTENVFATVGGPTYISSISFNAKDNSVYYTSSDLSEKGCPPVIHKVNLTTLKDSEIKSCAQLLDREYLDGYSKEGKQKYRQFVEDTYKDLSNLGSVSLEKNNIGAHVEFLSENTDGDYSSWWSESATLIQDNKEIAKINLRGCRKDQPHIFEGYMIPNSDIMAILISSDKDCFEGGYITETLHFIKGIRYYSTDIVNIFKAASATQPNIGNMVVYSNSSDIKDSENISSPQTLASQKKSNLFLNIALLASTFVVGAIFGYFVGKKSSRSQTRP